MSAGCVSAGRVYRQGAFAGRLLLPTIVWGDESATASEEAVKRVFIDQVRFIGDGVIAIASVWTLIKILKPIAVCIREAAIAAGKRHAGKKVDLTERDVPIQIVGATIALLMLPVGFLLADFVNGTAIHNSTHLMVVSVAFILLIGLVVAAVCGYMAGLIGSSNSPISGVGILVVLVGALAVKLAYGPADGSETKALIAFTLFTAAIVFGISTISNDNLQDLKTGQLVGATPWKQQVALVVGVLFGSAVIAPVLGLLQSTFGFAGAPGTKDNALNAPQASIISRLAKGIFDNSLDWTYIGWGAFIGVVVIVVDETLKRGTAGRLKLPPLAVGMGMYLMPTTTLTIALGAVLGSLYDGWAERSGGDVEGKKRMGVLMSTGLIVGESLFGVVYAGIVGWSSDDAPLAVVGEGFATPAKFMGTALFAAAVTLLYKHARAQAEK